MSKGGGGKDGGGRSPNDQRSDALNPNNPAYQAAQDNRSDQLNPDNPAYWTSRGSGRIQGSGESDEGEERSITAMNKNGIRVVAQAERAFYSVYNPERDIRTTAWLTAEGAGALRRLDLEVNQIERPLASLTMEDLQAMGMDIRLIVEG